jgi:hypothetical protein
MLAEVLAMVTGRSLLGIATHEQVPAMAAKGTPSRLKQTRRALARMLIAKTDRMAVVGQ